MRIRGMELPGRSEGSTIQVELNGVKILDTDLSEITEYMADRKHPGKMLAKGHLGFAGHGDEHTSSLEGSR